MHGFEVLKSGTWSSIQDLGRYGYTHLGVTNSGAMDEYAYRWTQKLLGNTDANAIEVLLGGLKLKATADVTIAVCGADLNFCINDEKQNIWQTHQIKKDDILGFYGHTNGLRVYLAVQDGFTVKKTQNSYAYCAKEDKGMKLHEGDLLPFQTSRQKEIRRVPKVYIPTYTHSLTLRILLDPQKKSFNIEAQETFFNSSYTLTPQISPMGYKLQGKVIRSSKEGIISEGIPFGAVQVPPDGQPIILLKERQTIGGYPIIGTVLASDCFALAQLPIGAEVRFKKIHIEEAQKEMKVFYRFFDQSSTSP